MSHVIQCDVCKNTVEAHRRIDVKFMHYFSSTGLAEYQYDLCYTCAGKMFDSIKLKWK